MLATAEAANLRQARLLTTLEELLEIAAVGLRPALNDVVPLIAQALDADNVDIFLYEASSDSLVATTRYDSPMGRLQRRAGLDRLPVGRGGLVVRAFLTGASFRTGHAGREPGTRLDIVEALGYRSRIICCLKVNGRAHGALQAASARPDWFSQEDLRFLEAASHWLGLVTRHAELADRITKEVRKEDRRRGATEVGRLTPREQEVAGLVAVGLTNEAIAERLVLVTGTVSNHVEHILRKLGFARRVQIATWAVEQGLKAPEGSAQLVQLALYSALDD